MHVSLSRRVCCSSVKSRLRSVSSKTASHTYISFFIFEKIQSPLSIADKLRADLKEERFRGTIYVAPEGLNGQFSIPTTKLSLFQQIITSAHPTFSSINFNLGDSFEEGENRDEITTFKRLSVKVREQILTDGLPKDETIDWKNCGMALPGEEWHKELEAMNKSATNTILLDCRNDYESDLGSFQNAVPLKTKVFSETFSLLPDLLREVPRDTRVLTFCTGGIRCVKVNAYLRQRLGFHNAATLKDGIVGYKKWLSSATGASDGTVQSLFRGDNYVFDRRRVQHMTVDEAISGSDVDGTTTTT